MFLTDIDSLTLPIRPQNVILKCISISLFFNIDYRYKYKYGGKPVEGNIKNSFYFFIKFLREVQRTCGKCPKVTPIAWCSKEVPRTSI